MAHVLRARAREAARVPAHVPACVRVRARVHDVCARVCVGARARASVCMCRVCEQCHVVSCLRTGVHVRTCDAEARRTGNSFFVVFVFQLHLF